jgi:hypothetical protein
LGFLSGIEAEIWAFFACMGKIFKGRQSLEGSPGRTKTNFKKLKDDEKLSKKIQSNDTKLVEVCEKKILGNSEVGGRFPKNFKVDFRRNYGVSKKTK